MKSISKKLLSFIILASLLQAMAIIGSCAEVTSSVQEINKYGNVVLDISIEEFESSGFSLGDVVTVEAGSYTGDMPYLNGYYVDRGEYLVCAYPGNKNIAVCINYGKFKEAAGVKEGDPVTIVLKEAEGAKLLQETFDLTYSPHRQDYDSDEMFANFRMITLDTIPDGKLYRSASPVHNDAGRSAYAYTLMIASGINAVMNLADSQEELTSLFEEEAFDAVEYRDMYEDDRVIALGMPVDYASDSFAQGIVEGLTFLSKKEPPYLIHCNEGKDRAGFTSMILEALAGADPNAIVEDYMLSYVNYYGTEPGKIGRASCRERV